MKSLPLIAYLKTWVRLVPLLVVTLENPIDRAGRGYRLDPLLLECLLDGRGATPFIVLGQGMMQVDDGLGEEGGRFGCRGPGSFAPLPRPGGIVCQVARLPLVEPTFRAGHLPTDVFDFVASQVSGDGLFTALFVVWGHWGLMLGLVFRCENGHLFSM